MATKLFRIVSSGTKRITALSKTGGLQPRLTAGNFLRAHCCWILNSSLGTHFYYLWSHSWPFSPPQWLSGLSTDAAVVLSTRKKIDVLDSHMSYLDTGNVAGNDNTGKIDLVYYLFIWGSKCCCFIFSVQLIAQSFYFYVVNLKWLLQKIFYSLVLRRMFNILQQF